MFSAPSNIALIKYMGKKPGNNNMPVNASLSMTLPQFQTFVDISISEKDSWACLPQYPMTLSQKGMDNILKHVSYLKSEFGISEHFLIQTGNNFPSDCGIASSASCFAALTEACIATFTKQTIDIQTRARFAQVGSGSACRSLISPWCLWNETGIHPIDLPELDHVLLLVSAEKKAISSREAHARVQTSLLFENRAMRAETRLTDLIHSLQSGDWQKSFAITWQEWSDMHALFETTEKPFRFMSATTHLILENILACWEAHQDGPLVTLDAGPNIHLLFRKDQSKLQLALKQSLADLPVQYWDKTHV